MLNRGTDRVDTPIPSLNAQTELQLIAAHPAVTSDVKFLSILSTVYDGYGKVLGICKAAAEFRPEDIVGVLPYERRGNELFIGALTSQRPALFARRFVNLPLLGGAHHDRQSIEVVGAIGGYLRSDDGIGNAAERVLYEKARLQPTGPKILLGSALLPNASISAELEAPVAIPSRLPSVCRTALPGSGFSAGRTLIVLSAQEVIDQFADGTITDPRLFLHTLTLHNQMRLAGESLLPLSPPHHLRSAVESGLSNLPICSMTARIVKSPSDLYRLREQSRTIPDVPVRVTVDKAIPETNCSPYRSFCLTVAPAIGSNSAPSASFHAEAIVREQDSILVVALARTTDGIAIPVNIGIRVPLELRDTFPRLLHSPTEAHNLETVSGSLQSEWADREATADRVRDIVARVAGMEVVGDPILTNMQGYWSPGFNTAGFRVAIAFVTGTPTVPLATPRAILESTEKDCGIRLAAHIARLYAEQSASALRSPYSALCAEEQIAYQQLMLSEGTVWPFIKERSPRIREILRQHRALEARITGRINAGGIRVEFPSERSVERYFFNSLMQLFVVHPKENPLTVLQLLIHDCFHYENPDPLPFRVHSITGELESIPFAEYAEAVLRREARAVVSSDDELPAIYGVKDFERETSAPSLSSLLDAAGLTRPEQRHDAVYQAIANGTLAPELIALLKIPSMLSRYEPVIRGVLLGYHLRDAKRNVEILYRAWRAMPRVAEIARRMGAPIFDAQGNAPHIKDAISPTDHTGRNPLQEALGDTRIHGLYQPALRLAWLREQLDPVKRRAECQAVDALLEQLVADWERLTAATLLVSGAENSEQNTAAFRLLCEVRSHSVVMAQRLIQVLEDSDLYFSAEFKESIKDRAHAPFPLLDFAPSLDEEIQAGVSKLLADQLRA